MALTLEKEQRLRAAELTKFFEKDQKSWKDIAKKSYDYVHRNFPANSRVRPDDVAKALEPIIEVSTKLRDYLNVNKLKQKYWIRDFTDLVIDRTWADISRGAADEKKES
jgi:hypothetical protein